MSVQPWSVVKPRVKAERAALAEALITAPAEEVERIQVQVQTIDRFVAWFEAGDMSQPLIGDAAPLGDY